MQQCITQPLIYPLLDQLVSTQKTSATQVEAPPENWSVTTQWNFNPQVAEAPDLSTEDEKVVYESKALSSLGTATSSEGLGIMVGGETSVLFGVSKAGD
ncbi:hypothetical protein ACLOJK_035494 [Asimina triloba]